MPYRYTLTALILFLLLPALAVAEPSLSGIDAAINGAIQPVADALSQFVFFEINIFGARVPVVVLWLIVAGIFFTVYFRFVSLWGFKHALRLVRGDYTRPEQHGEISPFQALSTAVSGTVGIGNIGNIAIIIAVGGPGAIFWMIIAGFLGMSIKFAECTLAVKYRSEQSTGKISGGPMYSLEKGLATFHLRYPTLHHQGNTPMEILERALGSLRFRRVGKLLGIFYGIGIVIGCLGIGNMFQSNQALAQFIVMTGGQEASWFADKGWLFGVIMASIVGVVILGGIKSIARVTEVIVPFMAIFYVGLSLVLIGMNYAVLPAAVVYIIEGAFAPQGITGGVLGVIIVGFQRAIFSNEAGIGTSAIAHSAVRTDEPVTEGFVGLLEPFIDTIVICTITALVIATTMVAAPGYLESTGTTGVAMTSMAFSRVIPYSQYLIAFAALLFAFSTTISWAYYGMKGWSYLLGEKVWLGNIFKFIFCAFIVIGCALHLDAVLSFSDALVFLLCIPNIIGLYILAPTIKRELNAYWKRLKRGEFPTYRKGKED